MQYDFISYIRVVGKFKTDWSQDQIKNEPMLFNCSIAFAAENAGPITKEFLFKIPKVWNNSDVIIDSRVHMLMPGWFACIPGYHHDDVARDISGQPNYDKQPHVSDHLLGLVNSEICPTVFAVGKHSLPKIEGSKIYKEWDKIVRKQIEEGILEEKKARSGEIYQFNWQTMHRGQEAVKPGWRWFIRLTKRNHNHTNEIRKQVNVYLKEVNEGW